jgi:hypothetical protein
MRIKATNDVKAQIEALIERKTMELESLKSRADIQEMMNAKEIDGKNAEINSLKNKQSSQVIHNHYQDYVQKSVDIPKKTPYDKVLIELKKLQSSNSSTNSATSSSSSSDDSSNDTESSSSGGIISSSTTNNSTSAINNTTSAHNAQIASFVSNMTTPTSPTFSIFG